VAALHRHAMGMAPLPRMRRGSSPSWRLWRP